MLIEAQYKVGDVVSIKLSSGEEMIARFEDENDDVVTVAKPYILIAAQNGMALAPYMFTIAPDTKVKLKINNVICIVKSAKDASDMYIKQSTGIAIASATSS
jgi:glycine cleavage system H lipoate-binding protein